MVTIKNVFFKNKPCKKTLDNGIISGEGEQMEEEENVEKRSLFQKIVEWWFCTLIALILALLTRYYLVTPTLVKQTSMYPTLEENNRLIISRVRRITNGSYKRGDIITFEEPSKTNNINLNGSIAIYDEEPEGIVNKFIYYVVEINKRSYIKRIIAVEGDFLEIKSGKVYINGEELEEEYLPEGTTTKTGYYNSITIPEGYVFVMGDNRENSVDSRSFGCIPVEKIEGKVILRYWPLTEASIM